jgi:acyl dehydratase
MSGDEIRYDDLPALEALVSDGFGPFGRELEVTQRMIDAFAELTGDHQWIHSDVERARRESPFGGTIAHGFLVLSLLGPLAEGTGPRIVGHRTVINYGAEHLRFVSPVPSASRIHARRRLVAARRKGHGTQITFETEARVVGGERPALVCRSLVLFL